MEKLITSDEQNGLYRQTPATPEKEAPFFFVHSDYKAIKIFHDDVLYIEGLKDYVKIFLTLQSRPILTRLNLKRIGAKLPSKDFCRIHNSYIVSFNKIMSIQKTQVLVQENAIPIGGKFAEEFRKKYKGSVVNDQ
jgi:DNA-binding LytR/AlgR family response regulator